MKKIITIILLLVALAVLIYQQTNNTIKKELRDFAVEDISTITKVFLADRHGHDVTLFKTDDKWLVENKYPARKDGIEIMLSTMNKVRVRQPVSESMHNNVIKNLAASSVKVEIFTDNPDEAEKTYYVGGEVADLLGSFMMMENSSKAFITHIPGFNGFLAPRYSIEGTRVSMDLWRDRSILNMDAADIEFVSIEHHEDETAEGNLYLDKVNGNFVLFENGEGSLTNQERVTTYLQLWGKANCEGFMNDFSKKDSIINSAPFHTIKVWSKDGEEKTIHTFHKAPKRAEYQDLNGQPLKWDVDRMYAYDGTDFTLIQFYTFNKLLLSPNDLR